MSEERAGYNVPDGDMTVVCAKCGSDLVSSGKWITLPCPFCQRQQVVTLPAETFQAIREALEFYGDPAKWDDTDIGESFTQDLDDTVYGKYLMPGAKARAALVRLAEGEYREQERRRNSL